MYSTVAKSNEALLMILLCWLSMEVFSSRQQADRLVDLLLPSVYHTDRLLANRRDQRPDHQSK